VSPLSRVPRFVTVAVAGLLGGLALAACGPGSPDQEDTKDWLEREIGFTAAQASCVVDQVWALGDDSEEIRDELAEQTPDLSDADEARLAQLVQACTTGN